MLGAWQAAGAPHLRVQVGGARGVGGAPDLLLLQDGHRVVPDDGLHEAAQAQDGEVEPRGGQELLRTRLDLHQRHVGVPVRVVDGEEHVALDAHGLPRARPHVSS